MPKKTTTKSKSGKHPGGRPSNYTPELAKQMCDLIATGTSVKALCSMDSMPSMKVFFSWIFKHEEFSNMYREAKEKQLDVVAEEILTIADEAQEDFITTEDGKTVLVCENINRSRLRVQTRQWVLERLRPKKYGPKSSTELTGGISIISAALDAADERVNNVDDEDD